MATINTTLGAGSTESPYFYDVRITKQLCKKTTNAPIFIPTFSMVSFKNVGTAQYEAIVNVQGVATYTPCNSCCAKAQTVNEQFVIPFYSVTTPTAVTVQGGTPNNSLGEKGCCRCSNIFTCDVPLTVTVTA